MIDKELTKSRKALALARTALDELASRAHDPNEFRHYFPYACDRLDNASREMKLLP